MKGGIMELNKDVLKYVCITEDTGEVTESEPTTIDASDLQAPVDVQETESGQADVGQAVEEKVDVSSQVEIDGEVLTFEQIKQFKQGYTGYSKQVSDYKALEAQSKEALDLYNYIKGNKDLAQKLYEFDQELNEGSIKEKLPSPEKEAITSMQQDMNMMKIERDLGAIKAKDSSVDEMALLQIATEQRLSLDIAYKVWKADNFETSLKTKLSEQSKNITKSLQDAKTATRSLITEDSDKNADDGRFGLSEQEFKFAERMEMKPQEYAEWKSKK